jgi:membrane-bound ClpP family serine protease
LEVVRMSEEHLPSHLQLGEFGQGAPVAGSAPLTKTSGGEGPDPRHLAIARKLSLSAALAVVGLVLGAIVLGSVLASGALPWIVGAILVVAAVGVVVLGAHAGGHGWFVPLPVLVLAAAWALAVSAGGWASATAWVFAALAFISAAVAAVLIVPAIGYRHAPSAASVGPSSLVGASGTSQTPLTPTGVVRVNKETWTAQSLSGPLPAGAPVHVVKVEGVRLMVWSEAGNVLGLDALGSTKKEKEEQ